MLIKEYIDKVAKATKLKKSENFSIKIGVCEDGENIAPLGAAMAEIDILVTITEEDKT